MKLWKYRDKGKYCINEEDFLIGYIKQCFLNGVAGADMSDIIKKNNSRKK